MSTTTSTKINVIADTRERAVFDTLRQSLDKDMIELRSVQINTGDYLICVGESDGDTGEECTILACVERKSLNDYAASIKDGRHANKQKLIDLRAETNCAIFYIVEGAITPSESTKFNRIPYKNIESSIFNLMVRDSIHVIRTKDINGTADALLKLSRAYNTHVAPTISAVTLKSLTMPITTTSDVKAVKILSALADVSEYLAGQVLQRCTIRTVFAELTDIDDNAYPWSNRLYYPTGCAASTRAYSSLKLAATQSLPDNVQTRVLTSFPSVGKTKIAALKKVGFNTIFTMSEVELANVDCGGRKLGGACAKAICAIFDHSVITETPQKEAAQVIQTHSHTNVSHIHHDQDEPQP
jgi:ERCC4-type nuclease